MEEQISAAPPPYTTRLSRTKFLTTQIASCRARLASSMICTRMKRFSQRIYCSRRRPCLLTILLLPLTKIVTALVLAQSSMTSIFSLVVPNEISRTIPAFPSLSAVRSSNRGTMRPFVAMAMSWGRMSAKGSGFPSAETTHLNFRSSHPPHSR